MQLQDEADALLFRVDNREFKEILENLGLAIAAKSDNCIVIDVAAYDDQKLHNETVENALLYGTEADFLVLRCTA